LPVFEAWVLMALFATAKGISSAFLVVVEVSGGGGEWTGRKEPPSPVRVEFSGRHLAMPASSVARP
jgi:hypothetical protein